MPFLIKQITEAVFVLFALVLLGDLCLIGIVLVRRKSRQKYFRRIDALRERYGPVIAGVLSGKVGYEKGLEELCGITCVDHLSMLEILCLEHKPAPAEEPRLRRLCEDLGLVRIWQQRLAGQIERISPLEVLRNPLEMLIRARFLRFLVRSKCAENLGFIRHEPSWPLLAQALENPSHDLQAAAVRALAAIRYPDSLPALVRQLHKVVLEPSPVFSVRTLKSALVSFRLENAGELAASLRHPNPRIRFLATDIIREMTERESGGNPDFRLDQNMTYELAELFLTELPFDSNPDVRARAAAMIACFDDKRSGPILLALLKDTAWFVRLHAVRSLAKPRFLSYADWVAHALADPDWRVREAAARTLKTLGPAGVDRLTTRFLSTQDRYCREQIADEFQRAGVIPQLLARCIENGDSQETAVLSRLVEMGKTSCIVSVLDLGGGKDNLGKEFLRDLGQKPALQIPQWIERLALLDSEVGRRAHSISAVKRPREKG